MLPEAGAFELFFLAAVALIVVGPKDLPLLMRKIAEYIAKLRRFIGEFHASFNELGHHSELQSLRMEVEALKRGQFHDLAMPQSSLPSQATLQSQEPVKQEPRKPQALGTLEEVVPVCETKDKAASTAPFATLASSGLEAGKPMTETHSDHESLKP